MHLEQGRNDDERDRYKNIGYSLHDKVGRSAVVAGDGAPDNSNEEVDYRNAERKDERESGAGGKAGEDILAVLVGAENVAGIKLQARKRC